MMKFLFNKNNHNVFWAERGQALTELVCVLPLLLCVMLIVLFIAGTGLSGIKAVKEARSAAESKALHSSGGGGDTIRSWDYRGIVPFSALDKPRTGGSVSSPVTDALDNSRYSEYEKEIPRYRFTSIRTLDASDEVEKSVFAERPDMYRQAAELVQGRADESADSDNLFYSRWRRNSINSYELTFTRFFSVRINDLDIAKQRANTVYFPSLK